MFSALGDYLQSPRIQVELEEQLDQNRQFWKRFDDDGVDHADLLANVPRLQSQFLRLTAQKTFTQQTFTSVNSHNSRHSKPRY